MTPKLNTKRRFVQHYDDDDDDGVVASAEKNWYFYVFPDENINWIAPRTLNVWYVFKVGTDDVPGFCVCSVVLELDHLFDLAKCFTIKIDYRKVWLRQIACRLIRMTMKSQNITVDGM